MVPALTMELILEQNAAKGYIMGLNMFKAFPTSVIEGLTAQIDALKESIGEE
jgi:hypothetical protein